VVGSSSFGKGTVQTVMRMPNDGELILTWARLITPAGYRLQRHGVVPTICTSGLTPGRGATLRVLAMGSLRPRAALSDAAWSELRKSCPARQASPPIDLQMAEQLLADPKLYAEALHSLPSTANYAQNTVPPAPARAAPALTGVKRTLSFEAQ
jgi:carboxyl-terminal processing protease